MSLSGKAYAYWTEGNDDSTSHFGKEYYIRTKTHLIDNRNGIKLKSNYNKKNKSFAPLLLLKVSQNLKLEHTIIRLNGQYHMTFQVQQLDDMDIFDMWFKWLLIYLNNEMLLLKKNLLL